MTMRAVWAGVLMAVLAGGARAQDTGQQQKTPPAATDDQNGPQTVDSGVELGKKKEQPAPPPPAPAEEKPANPNGEIYSLRVDVPIVNLDVNVLADRTHQFIPGLKPENFLVVEDGVEQNVTSVRVVKKPITAVLLLEFAATSWPFVQDMQNASAAFYRSLQPDDYVAVETYDIKPHILTDFTNNKETIAEALQSLIMPTWRETNMFDALYETLDRLTRVDGQKYIILIGSGRDTMSKLTWDQMMAKIKATQNVTIFTISTGDFARTMSESTGRQGSISHMDYLQADNEMRTIASMTGGMNFKPMFQGAMPDVFTQIGESIRNQYVLTYRPTNAKNDGSWRKIKVYLVDQEGRPLKMQDEKGKAVKYSVISRDGYRAKLPVE